jgi:tetratricopeptide (TPR) repeat protein
MKVTLSELLLSRAIAYEIAAALDAAQRDDFRRRAADDQEDGKRLVDGLEGAPDVDRVAKLRALARLAAGRAEAEVLPLVPAAATETKLIVQAAVLWQDLEAPVPAGLVAGLSELPARSGLGESALALALVRAGDSVAARNAAEHLLVGAGDQVVALAVRAHLSESAEPSGEDKPPGEGEPTGDTAGDPNVAKAPPRPGESDGGGAAEAGGGGGGAAAGSSFDKLVERGCSQVSGGEAAAGIKTLMRAFDMKDNNLDVLVCLAEGYAVQGQSAQAATFFDRALEQSPSNIPALRGAAKLAAKTGADQRALKLYERLLAADPNNATAQAYLAKHAPKDDPPAEPPAETSGG